MEDSKNIKKDKSNPKLSSGPTSTIDINLNLVRQCLIGDHVEIEDLKLPKYNQFVSDCLLLGNTFFLSFGGRILQI